MTPIAPGRDLRRMLYILVEVGSRELLSRMILAEQARRRGYRVVVGEKNLLRNLCWLFRAPRGIILDKCGQNWKTYPIRALRRRGFVYAVLDEEGLLYSHSNRLPGPGDLMLFNSEYQRRLSGCEAREADIVGNPRLNPRELLPYLQDEVSWIRDRYGDFVLVCSSFDPRMESSYAFPEEARLDERYREAFLAIITRLARSVPLVYRPHPSDGDGFAERVKHMVPVERRFTILPWIAASKLVLNAKCTSSLEALRLGVPSATLSFKSRNHAKVNALSRRFYDVDSLCRYIEAGHYGLELSGCKQRYVAAICGPERPAERLLQRLDAVELPGVNRFAAASWGARATSALNRVVYGPTATAYMLDKFGRHTYADRFPGFRSYLQGRLIMSEES